MTLVEVAAAAGVSKVAVSKKKLPHSVNTDGSFFYDPTNPEVMAYINRKSQPRLRTQRKQAEKAKETPAERRKRTVAEAKSDESRSDQGGEEPDDPDDSDLDAQFLRVKIEEKTITNAQKRGELIPVALVRQFIQRIYAADSDELDQLSNRLAGKISGEARGAKSDAEASIRVAHILSQESARIKKHIHAVQKDFTKRYPEADSESP